MKNKLEKKMLIALAVVAGLTGNVAAMKRKRDNQAFDKKKKIKLSDVDKKLYEAVESGDYDDEEIKTLINSKSVTNQGISNSFSFAVMNEDDDFVKLLIDSGKITLEMLDNPLHQASINSNKSCFILIKKFLSNTFISGYGIDDLLIEVAKQGYNRLVRFLIENYNIRRDVLKKALKHAKEAKNKKGALLITGKINYLPGELVRLIASYSQPKEITRLSNKDKYYHQVIFDTNNTSFKNYPSIRSLSQIALAGNVFMLDWILKKLTDKQIKKLQYDINKAFVYAALNGNLKVIESLVKFLDKKKMRIQALSINLAFACAHTKLTLASDNLKKRTEVCDYLTELMTKYNMPLSFFGTPLSKTLHLCLKSSANKGYLEVVKYLLKFKIPSNDKLVALELAAKSGDFTTFMYLYIFLLKNKVSINVPTMSKALLNAASTNNLKLTQKILEYLLKVVPNKRSYLIGSLPSVLIQAAKNGRLNIFIHFYNVALKHNFPVTDSRFIRAYLCAASDSYNLGLVKFLLKILRKHAETQGKEEVMDYATETASLLRAAKGGHLDVFKHLYGILPKRNSINISKDIGKMLLVARISKTPQLVEFLMDILSSDSQTKRLGMSKRMNLILTEAAGSGNLELVKFLVNTLQNNKTDNFSAIENALIRAMKNFQQNKDIIFYLFNLAKQKDGTRLKSFLVTNLKKSCYSSDSALAQCLLYFIIQNKVSLSNLDNYDIGLMLANAAKNVHAEFVNTLGAFIKQNKIGINKSPLNQALKDSSRNGKLNCVKILLGVLSKHNIHIASRTINTQLTNASKWGHLEIVRYLLKFMEDHGITIDRLDKAIDNAYSYDREETLKVLTDFKNKMNKKQ